MDTKKCLIIFYLKGIYCLHKKGLKHHRIDKNPVPLRNSVNWLILEGPLDGTFGEISKVLGSILPREKIVWKINFIGGTECH